MSQIYGILYCSGLGLHDFTIPVMSPDEIEIVFQNSLLFYLSFFYFVFPSLYEWFHYVKELV